jgi:hypothetical protein
MTKSVCAAWADGRVSAGFCGVAKSAKNAYRDPFRTCSV